MTTDRAMPVQIRTNEAPQFLTAPRNALLTLLRYAGYTAIEAAQRSLWLLPNAYQRSSADRDLDLLERYFWNMALWEAMYPPLQSLEIALRNNVHDAATRRYGTTEWLIQRPPVLHACKPAEVGAALGRIGRSSKQVKSSLIVAELHFGFWTSLPDRRYEQRLWPHLLRDVFPNLPRRRTRHTASARMSEMRRLRNRAFHHEPI